MNQRWLTAILALVWIPAAQAATMVWFETPNTHGNGGGAGPSGGAPGLPLYLWCDISGPPGVCAWQIQMKAALGPGGVVGWSLDLRTAPGNGVSTTNPQIPPGSPFNSPAFPGTPGSGQSLLTFAAGQTFSVPPQQTLTLLTFTLRKSYVTGDLTLWSVWGGPSVNNAIVWTNFEAGDYEVVQFGPNPPMLGFEGNFGIFPMIQSAIPEPGSLSLLVLGAAVCRRRRRGCRIN